MQGGGRARPGVVNEETRWVRENERVRLADQGWCGGRREGGGGGGGGGVCPGKKSIQSDRDNVFV